MHLNSTHIQRELAWLLDAIYKLSPEEFRADAAGATANIARIEFFLIPP